MIAVLETLFTAARPILPHLAILIVLILILRFPMPGRGPGPFARRSTWRLFKYGNRSQVLDRAGHRCEAPMLLMWGRCPDQATEVDHIYPWSKGGATTASNGQALCRHHNRKKGNLAPPWWYIMGLERRRRRYFPHGAEITVRARDVTVRT